MVHEMVPAILLCYRRQLSGNDEASLANVDAQMITEQFDRRDDWVIHRHAPCSAVAVDRASDVLPSRLEVRSRCLLKQAHGEKSPNRLSGRAPIASRRLLCALQRQEPTVSFFKH